MTTCCPHRHLHHRSYKLRFAAIEELEQKEWTSLIDEQRCHQVMMERFLRFTTEEDRQRDRNCGNAMFRRFGITQSSTAPLPGYYTRAVISHMGW